VKLKPGAKSNFQAVVQKAVDKIPASPALPVEPATGQTGLPENAPELNPDAPVASS
jgi:hypothetical protein